MTVKEKTSPRLAGVKAMAKMALKLRIGVIGAGANKTHDGPVEKGTKALTVGEIAAKHELGLGVPQRSFIRAYVDQNKPRIENELRAVLKRVKDGQLTAAQAGPLLGMRYVSEIQQFIADKKVQPPNTPYTIAKKGSSTPLIDTGQLRSAITWFIEGAKAGEAQAGSAGGVTKRRATKEETATKKHQAGAKKKARAEKKTKRERARRVKKIKKLFKRAGRSARDIRRGAKRAVKSLKRSVRRARKALK